LQARPLDLIDRLFHQLQTGDIAAQLGQGVGRQCRPLRRAQSRQALRALRRFGLKWRMPSRARGAFMRLTMRVRWPTSASRLRLGRRASSAASVGIPAILQ
jgi:hypothetical protein